MYFSKRVVQLNYLSPLIPYSGGAVGPGRGERGGTWFVDSGRPATAVVHPPGSAGD